MRRITLVGENRMFLNEAQTALGEEFEVEVVSSFDQSVPLSAQISEQVLLIDCPPEKIQVLEMVKKIRTTFPSTKFIVTSSVTTKEILLECLNLRVDGYHERPASLESLRQRIRQVFSADEPDEIQVDSFRRTVLLGVESIPLTKTEFSLLMLFREKAGIFLSRQQISELVWPNSQVAKNNLDTHLSRLRSKIPPLKTRLLCLRGEGFVYTPPGSGPSFIGQGTKRR